MNNVENAGDKQRRTERLLNTTSLIFLVAILAAVVVLFTIITASSHLSEKSFPAKVAEVENTICGANDPSSYVLFNDDQLRKGYSSSKFLSVAAVGFHRTSNGSHEVWQPVNKELNVLGERSYYGDTYDKPANVRSVQCDG